jgi:hypothetical protein
VLLQNIGQQPVVVCWRRDCPGQRSGRRDYRQGTIVGNAANVWVRSPGGTSLAVTVGHSGGVSGNRGKPGQCGSRRDRQRQSREDRRRLQR